MDLNLTQWDELSYKKFQEYLQNIKEEKYKEFSSKLTKTKYPILGIRVPVLRKIAKEIFKGNYNSFLKCSLDDTFEEVFIQGLVVSNIKEETKFLRYVDNFVLKIDDWSICDSFCNSLKIVNNNLNKYFEYFTKYLDSNKEFKIRVSLIVYLGFSFMSFSLCLYATRTLLTVIPISGSVKVPSKSNKIYLNIIHHYNIIIASPKLKKRYLSSTAIL